MGDGVCMYVCMNPFSGKSWLVAQYENGINKLYLYVCIVSKRPVPADMPLRYYTAAMHSASFVLPGSTPVLYFHRSPHIQYCIWTLGISPALDAGQTSPFPDD